MDEETTRKLEEQLKTISSERDAESFVEKHSGSGFASFYDYLNAFMEDKGIEIKDIAAGSNINPNYVYQLINGRKKNPGRDKVLAICIASGMDYRETNRALEVAGHRALYPKDERDAWIAISINNGERDVVKVNELLDSKGLKVME